MCGVNKTFRSFWRVKLLNTEDKDISSGSYKSTDQSKVESRRSLCGI